MRQVHRKGLATVMLTGGVLAMAGYAQADSHADGGAADSPGLLAGNTVQLPVDVPLNVCGNTVNVVGLLNPAAGNTCANRSDGGPHHGRTSGAHHGHTSGGPHHGHSSGGATAEGGAKDSPGVLSGNGVQLPVDLPVNVTGNSVNVVGIANPAVGNSSSNTPGKPPVRTRPSTPPKPAATHPHPRTHAPAPAPETPSSEVGGTKVSLAHTGAGSIAYGVPASAALLLGGVVLYRRTRVAGER
ncbi:chaplin family protein [Streptomyces sp. NBC_00829]|uniref:chaplin n=1 Tax=Streptomyces sp. NBC_00829 TaxID=2903679 RepID=UPI00386E0CF7